MSKPIRCVEKEQAALFKMDKLAKKLKTTLPQECEHLFKQMQTAGCILNQGMRFMCQDDEEVTRTVMLLQGKDGRDKMKQAGKAWKRALQKINAFGPEVHVTEPFVAYYADVATVQTHPKLNDRLESLIILSQSVSMLVGSMSENPMSKDNAASPWNVMDKLRMDLGQMLGEESLNRLAKDLDDADSAETVIQAWARVAYYVFGPETMCFGDTQNAETLIELSKISQDVTTVIIPLSMPGHATAVVWDKTTNMVVFVDPHGKDTQYRQNVVNEIQHIWKTYLDANVQVKAIGELLPEGVQWQGQFADDRFCTVWNLALVTRLATVPSDSWQKMHEFDAEEPQHVIHLMLKTLYELNLRCQDEVRAMPAMESTFTLANITFAP